MKPLFRWIIGDTKPEGFKSLSLAIRNAQKLYFEFDFLICSNAKKIESKEKITQISKKFKVPIYEQSWSDLPINPSYILNSKDPSNRQGTFWKLCPCRIRIQSHEIICDNDLILNSRIDSILSFLKSDVPLLMKEDAFCVGKYFFLFKEKENYNSGLFGLPPGYNLEKDLNSFWIENFKFDNLSWRDEQGLLTATLKRMPHIHINANEIIHLFDEGRCCDFNFDFIKENNIKTRIMKNMKFKNYSFSMHDKGYHFLGINHSDSHKKWQEFKKNNITL